MGAWGAVGRNIIEACLDGSGGNISHPLGSYLVGRLGYDGRQLIPWDRACQII